MKTSLVVFVLLAAASLSAYAQTPELDKACLAGQEAMFRLRYDEAERIFEKMRRDYPDSPVPYGMLSILAWNRLVLAAGNMATDDYGTPGPLSKERTSKDVRKQTDEFHQANALMLKITDRAIARNPKDVLARYFRGLYYENLAAEGLAIPKANDKVLSNGRTSARIHEEVLRSDPSLVDANMSVAATEFAKDNFRGGWKFFKIILFLFGVRGDEKRAFERLELVAREGRYRRLDAQVVRGVLHAWKKDPAHARQSVNIFEALRRQFPENYLLDINLAAIYQQTDLNDSRGALRIYQDLLANIGRKTPGIRRGEVHYRIGLTHYRLKNYSEALKAFDAALGSERGEVETVPLANYYKGRIHEEQGDRASARRAFQETLKYRNLRSIEHEIQEAGNKVR